MKRKQMPKPRDPFVQHIVKRKSGAHQKPYKVSRRDVKVEMKKDYSDKHDDVSPSSLYRHYYGPLVEWFNVGFLIPVPGFDSQRVHQLMPV